MITSAKLRATPRLDKKLSAFVAAVESQSRWAISEVAQQGLDRVKELTPYDDRMGVHKQTRAPFSYSHLRDVIDSAGPDKKGNLVVSGIGNVAKLDKQTGRYQRIDEEQGMPRTVTAVMEPLPSWANKGYWRMVEAGANHPQGVYVRGDRRYLRWWSVEGSRVRVEGRTQPFSTKPVRMFRQAAEAVRPLLHNYLVAALGKLAKLTRQPSEPKHPQVRMIP